MRPHLSCTNRFGKARECFSFFIQVVVAVVVPGRNVAQVVALDLVSYFLWDPALCHQRLARTPYISRREAFELFPSTESRNLMAWQTKVHWVIGIRELTEYIPRLQIESGKKFATRFGDRNYVWSTALFKLAGNLNYAPWQIDVV